MQIMPILLILTLLLISVYCLNILIFFYAILIFLYLIAFPLFVLMKKKKQTFKENIINKKNIFGVIKGNEDKYDNLLKLQKTFEKISSKRCKEILKKAKNQNEHEIIKVPVYNKKKTEIKEYKEVKGRKIIKYYLIYKINFKKEYSNLINITQDKKFFNIKELKTDEINNNKENIEKNIENSEEKITEIQNIKDEKIPLKENTEEENPPTYTNLLLINPNQNETNPEIENYKKENLENQNLKLEKSKLLHKKLYSFSSNTNDFLKKSSFSCFILRLSLFILFSSFSSRIISFFIVILLFS